MVDYVNLCDNEIEDNGIAKEENSEEESKDGANKLVSKLNMKCVLVLLFIKAGEDKVPLCDEINKLICTYTFNVKIVPAKYSNTTNLFKYLQRHHTQDANIALKNS